VHIAGWFAPGRLGRGQDDSARSHRLLRLAAAPALALGIFVAGPLSGATEPPVAVIGGTAISGDEYVAYLRNYLRSKLYHGGSPDRVRALADEALERMIDDRLLSEAAGRRGIEGDKAAVAAQMEQLRTKYAGSENWPSIEASLPDIEAQLLLRSRIEVLKAEVITVAPPGEAALRAFYAANPDLFTQPPASDLDLILIGVAPSALAPEWDAALTKTKTIRAAAMSGRLFDELARESSTHESAARGGKLGPVHTGQLPGEAETAVAALQPGEISEPVRLLVGYALLRLNSREAAELQPFDVVRERAEGLYLRDRASAQWRDFIAGLRAETTVETFDVSSHVQKILSGE
jgi:peptidyl-prolyl cis-trans isomerase C